MRKWVYNDFCCLSEAVRHCFNNMSFWLWSDWISDKNDVYPNEGNMKMGMRCAYGLAGITLKSWQGLSKVKAIKNQCIKQTNIHKRKDSKNQKIISVFPTMVIILSTMFSTPALALSKYYYRWKHCENTPGCRDSIIATIS